MKIEKYKSSWQAHGRMPLLRVGHQPLSLQEQGEHSTRTADLNLTTSVSIWTFQSQYSQSEIEGITETKLRLLRSRMLTLRGNNDI